LVQAPVLALLNFSKPFALETDASDSGIGAVLLQEGHPLAFLSKALGPKSKGLSSYEKEYMAILIIVQQWRSYLQRAEFIIYTYHKSLSQLNVQRLHRVAYKKGSDNHIVDALSRRSHDESTLCLLSTPAPKWLQTVQNTSDATARELLTKLALSADSVQHFTLKDGLLWYNSRIWVGNDTNV
jgi:hypothetical protein